MQHADNLFGQRACPAHDAPRLDVLHNSGQPRAPIDSVMRVKILVFRSDEHFLQKFRNFVQLDCVKHIKPVLIRHVQRFPAAVQKLLFFNGKIVQFVGQRRGVQPDNQTEHRNNNCPACKKKPH